MTVRARPRVSLRSEPTRSWRLALAAGLLALATLGCLYEPPRRLPSSIRLLYSRTTYDSLGTKVDIYFLVAREGNELQLTGEAGDDRQPTFASGLRKVFFTRRLDGKDEIWSMDLDGSQEQAVFAGLEGHRDPAVSPDETRIAYTRLAGGREEVWIADVDGGNPRPLAATGGPWREPAWSPDGRTIAIVGGAPVRLYLIPADGGNPRALAAEEPAPHAEPAWSPDGERIAFVRGEGRAADIAIVAVATGRIERLTDNNVAESSPAWSPDGERIAFVARRPNDRHNLWLIDPDGDNAESLTRYDRAEARDPDWL